MSCLSGIPTLAKVILPIGVGAALAGAIAWGASGAGTRSSPSAPTPLAAAQTQQAERTPGPPPWDPARPDCPPGWQVYNDPGGYFSICYPPGLLAIEGPPPTGVASAFTLTDPENAASRSPVNVFALHISRIQKSAKEWGPSASPIVCATYSGGISSPSTSEFVQLSFGGRAFVGCQATGQIGRGPETLGNDLRVMAPASADGTDKEGFVVLTVTSIGPDMRGTFNRASTILSTIRFK